MGHIVPHLAALCYLLPIREGHFLMNTLHHANLSGWDFLRLAEQASGQPAKKKQGGKYQLPCPLRDHAKPGGFVVFPNSGVGYCVKCGQKASQVSMFAGWLRQSETSTREWLRRQRDPAHAPTSPLRQPLAQPSSPPAVSH